MTHERLTAIRAQLELWRLFDVDVLNGAALTDLFVTARNIVSELVEAAAEDANPVASAALNEQFMQMTEMRLNRLERSAGPRSVC